MSDIADAARKYLGVRWVHQGRSRVRGLDCLGLVVVTMQDLGLEVEDCTAYRRLPDDKKLLRMVDAQMDKVALEDMLPGDVLLMHFKDRLRSPYHFAILDEDGYMIHGYAPARQVVRVPVADWIENIHSVYRVPR